MERDMPAFVGPYRVDGVLGHGASGVVLRGHDLALDRPVAIKLLTDDFDPEALGRFEIEARAAARIVHPNVVQVFGAGTHDDDTYITQELIDGHPLSAVLDARTTLSWAAVVDVGLQVAEGLAAAEAVGVLHRDIKPHNLLVTDDGLIKIADFGLAKILDAPSQYTESGTTLGTPHYMSPEQGQGKTLDARSDQYALGATLFHLLTGVPLFDADTAVATLFKHATDPLPDLRAEAPDCPPALQAIVERMLAKAPDDRYAGFDELIDALVAVAPGDAAPDLAEIVQAAAADRERPAPVRSRPGGTERALLAFTGIVAVAVIAAATYTPSGPTTTGVQIPTASAAPRIPVVPSVVRDPFDPPVAAVPVVTAAAPKPRPTSQIERYIRDLRRPGRPAIRAAKELGEKDDQRATLPLIAALEGSDARLAAAAADALGALGDIRAIEPLARAAQGADDPKVRDAAGRAHRRLWHVEE